MSKTITFGAFLDDVDEGRLTDAREVARSLGITVTADGSRFAGMGRDDDPIKVVATLPVGTAITGDLVRRGRDAFDALLDDGERLTDYAVIHENGQQVGVASLLTGEVVNLTSLVQNQAAASAPEAPAPRRWSPFRR